MRGVCNQTWLNPPMDGCKGDYITKLWEKKIQKKKKKSLLQGIVGKGMMLGQKLTILLNTYLRLC